MPGLLQIRGPEAGYDRPGKTGITFQRQAVRIVYMPRRHRRGRQAQVLDNGLAPAKKRLTPNTDRNNVGASRNVESRLCRVALVAPSRDGI